MLEERFKENDTFEPKTVFVDGEYYLEINEQVVRASANAVLGVCNVYLPRVNECKGMRYYVLAIDADGGFPVYVKHLGESLCYDGHWTLDAPCDGVVLQSDGEKFWEVARRPVVTATTVLPTTLPPTTLAPTTIARTTAAPTTLAPTTGAPTTLATTGPP